MQYRIGTATFTNGSATVTGSGTAWLSNLSAGDYIVRKGDTNNTYQAYEIGGITNDTTLTLTAPYGGNSASGAEYAAHIDFLPSGAPKFDNADIETASILNAHLTKLEPIENLGTAAYLNAQTSSTDATADRLMKVGAFGLGVSAIDLQQGAGVDLDTFKTSGLYTISSATNAPDEKTYTLQVLAGHTANRTVQIAHYNDPEVNNGEAVTYQRYIDSSGVSSNWAKIFNNYNILGNVSQSGGVPTGAIIERGSNANGEYVKFAGGLAICFHDAFTSADYSNSSGEGGYYTSLGALSWNFPITFVTAPEAMCSVRLSQSGTTRRTANNHTHSSNTASATFTASAGASFNGSNDVSLIAIGRWHN